MMRLAIVLLALAACRGDDSVSLLQLQAQPVSGESLEPSLTTEHMDGEEPDSSGLVLTQNGNERNQPKRKGAMKGKNKGCKLRCHMHPKQNCKRICRYQCKKNTVPPPVVHPKCKKPGATTMTTTVAASTTMAGPTTRPKIPLETPIFNETNPPTEVDVCDRSIIIHTTFENLAENTLGKDVANPRLFFKDVITMKFNGVERSFDMSITDVSSLPYYSYVENNVVDGVPFTKYTADTRQLTGVYLATARIGIDNPGTYVFRMSITDSITGQPVKVPMAPLTFYDIDGKGEVVATCDATSLIGIDTALTEKTENGCYVHGAKGREVNLPQNFESLSGPQKAQSITYVYTDFSHFDVQFHLSADTPQRYFIFKSSTVLACDDGSDNDDSNDDGGAYVAAACTVDSDCQPGQSCISNKCKKEKQSDV